MSGRQFFFLRTIDGTQRGPLRSFGYKSKCFLGKIFDGSQQSKKNGCCDQGLEAFELLKKFPAAKIISLTLSTFSLFLSLSLSFFLSVSFSFFSLSLSLFSLSLSLFSLSFSFFSLFLFFLSLTLSLLSFSLFFCLFLFLPLSLLNLNH
jgi:hypothetical protein